MWLYENCKKTNRNFSVKQETDLPGLVVFLSNRLLYKHRIVHTALCNSFVLIRKMMCITEAFKNFLTVVVPVSVFTVLVCLS